MENILNGNGPRPEASSTLDINFESKDLASEILKAIQDITMNQSYLTEGLLAIKELVPEGGHDIATQAKADAIGDIVKSREETNRRAISLLETMYDRQKPAKTKFTDLGVELEDIFHYLPEHDRSALLRDMLNI